MEKVIYSNKGGLGIILDIDDKESDYFDDSSFMINGEIIIPECETTLFGMFDKPARFVGALRDDPKCMIFHLGDNTDLFDTYKYYSCFYWIAENRICNKYTELSARDFLFVNGKWK
jgi:hypothetical protein